MTEYSVNAISTSKLLSQICDAQSGADATRWHDLKGEPSLGDVLYAMLDQRKLSPKEVIRRCRLERSYFYHILSGKRRPSRNMMLRIGFCIGTSLTEMERLLRLSETTDLYPKIRRDALLIFAIQNRYDMDQANSLLLENGELPLFRENQEP